MAKAKKLPSGNWRVQATATINGEKITKSFTDSDPDKAELAAKQWQVYHKNFEKDSSDLSLEQAIDEYIKIKDSVLSPSTIRGYNTIKNNSIDGIKQIPLKKLSQNVLQKYINQLSKSKSPKTVRNVYGLITAVMAQFAPEYLPSHVSLPQPIIRPKRALSKDQIQKLLQSIEGHRNEIPFLLALWMGLRQSEILALSWDDIDLEKNTIYIHSAAVPDKNNKYVYKQTTKNVSSTRTMRLPSYIKEKMLKMQDRSGRVYKYSPSVLFKDLKKMLNEIGIPDISLHDLRRTMATLGVSLNISDKVMMSRGGWSNPATMKKIYQVVLDQDTKIADDLIDSFFESVINNIKKYN